MSTFLSGLHLLASWQSIVYIVAGLVLGFLVGLIPGMGAANACAILLPFTINVPVVNGLLLMVAVYAGTSYSMAIPAILLNIPTEPGAAVTALDGYQMARQGRAAEAIGVARLASVTGGVIGIGAALILLQPLAGVALKFGPGELFILALIGMTIIGGIVADSPIKGMLAGAFGFLVAGMGVNPLTSEPRLDFGQIPLFDGVPFIPAVIGLFAVSEMFFLVRRSRGGRISSPGAHGDSRHFLREGLGGMNTGLRTTAQHPGAVIRSGVLGLLMGMVPGIGHSVANFISYAFGRSRSKNPETWGTGNPEGVIASEGCDNGVTGGTMIPMLALGIPGSATTAVLLSALALHGIQTGPQVLSSHGDLAYATLSGLFIANLLILPLGVVLALPMIYITRIKLPILVPVVLVLSLVGTFAYRQYIFDLGLVLLFGVVGIFMRLGGFPLVPFLIGLVLGPQTEQNLLLSLEIGRNHVSYFVSTALDKGLVALLVLLILAFARSAYKRSHGGKRIQERALVNTAAAKPAGPAEPGLVPSQTTHVDEKE
jgi:putative tricarboxylic transport membrane protein